MGWHVTKQVKFVYADGLTMLTNYCPKSNLWLQMAKQCWPTTVPSQIRVCRWLNTIDQLLSSVKLVSADAPAILTNYWPKSNSCLLMAKQYWPTTVPSQIRVCRWLNTIDQLLSQVKFVAADSSAMMTHIGVMRQWWPQVPIHPSDTMQ